MINEIILFQLEFFNFSYSAKQEYLENTYLKKIIDVFDKCHMYLKKLKLMFALIIFIFSSSATAVKFDLEFVHVFTQTKKKLTFSFSCLLGTYFGLIHLSKS